MTIQEQYSDWKAELRYLYKTKPECREEKIYQTTDFHSKKAKCAFKRILYKDSLRLAKDKKRGFRRMEYLEKEDWVLNCIDRSIEAMNIW